MTLAQPDALGVRGDVLDLVGDRAAVGLLEVGQRLGQRLARDVDAQKLGRHLGHVLRREAQRRGIERRVAGRLGAERIEARGHVPEVAVGLHQRHRRGDRLELLCSRPLAGAGGGADAASAAAGTGSSVVTSAARAPSEAKASA